MAVLKARISGQWVDVSAAPTELVVQEEGTTLNKRGKLNFIGKAITAADDAANDRTNISVADGLLYLYGTWTSTRAWPNRDVAMRFGAYWVWTSATADPISSLGPGTNVTGWQLLSGVPQMSTAQLAAWTTSLAGDKVFHTDLRTEFTRYGGAWVPSHGFVYDTYYWYGVCTVGGDVTSATGVLWGMDHTVTVPAGARQCEARFTMHGAAVSGVWLGSIQLDASGTGMVDALHQSQNTLYAAQDGSGTTPLGFSDEPVTPGGAIRFRTYAWRSSGAGALRDGRSHWDLGITWRNTPTTSF